ncbi:hypothetical protein CC80DRAFT_486042 [Byssothecium circinans]|uniref:Enhancer of mRNA-decapping protein 3 n=1 Tax=Byssothecium circinans TaxID=147558 RepID=A0A6A5T8N2_9PLEO|nr:hypothetical protein CC80DRAFT_486042 [Byssothecium circinans]
MAENSIKARIAALNIEQVHSAAPTSRPTYSYDQATTTKKKPPPPPPPGQRPSISRRQQTVNNPPIQSNAPTSARHLGNQPAPIAEPKRSPALPPRPPPRNNSKVPPSLPPRQPTDPIIKRRESNESIATVSSGISSLSLGSAYLNNNGEQRFHIRAPPFDPNKLPPLPTKAKEDPKEESSIRKMMASKRETRSPIALPPMLPTRPRTQPKDNDKPARRNLPPPKSALEWGLNKATETPPPLPSNRPFPEAAADAGAPPPVPIGSRPNLDAIMASKPKPGAQPQHSAQDSCLICRDFSAPDHHAAQFPRETLPSSDAGWLAQQLTAPFSSPTDKARAIFTWLHHNIDYDCHSFFSGNISPSTPEGTIKSGLAVCEGYAGLFAALALKAGLEAIVVTGHGKGVGHTAIVPGGPLPQYDGNHAWNAVRIDNGQWKLIDPCWGAGALGCNNTYSRGFTSAEFTKSNIDFGYTHFPEDKSHFFREDGRIFTWEEYCMDDAGGRVQIYGTPSRDLGIGARTFQPAKLHIKVDEPREPTIRFSFAVQCMHWNHERHGGGKPYIMTLNVGGRDGRNTKQVPFNTDGKAWWLDIDRRELGAPGQKINVCYITQFDGKDGRGLSLATYNARKGRAWIGLWWHERIPWENNDLDALTSRLIFMSFFVCIVWQGIETSTAATLFPHPTYFKIGSVTRSQSRVGKTATTTTTSPSPPPKRKRKPPRSKQSRCLLLLRTRQTAIMASGLIGISVTVTLQNPPNTIVEGRVADVNPQTSTLTLQNVLFPATGHRLQSYHVEGHAIADIKVNTGGGPGLARPMQHAMPQVQQMRPPHQMAPPHHMPQPPQALHAPQTHIPPAPQSAPFVDPAILSMGKRSSVAPARAVPLEAPATPIKPLPVANTVAPVPTTSSPFTGHTKGRATRKPSAATLEGPFSSLDIADAEQDSDDTKTIQPAVRRTSINKTRTGKPMDEPAAQAPARNEEGNKKTRRGGKARKKEVAAQERRNGGDLQSSPDAVRKGKGNGWRQTPILEDASQPPTRTPGVIGGKVGLEAVHALNKKTKRQRALEAKNGWATEDATDIQDLPEFDFAENLSKFDKRTVFNQIRNEDTTADEDRLVSFNRLARPGTHGGKNLHPTENVLDSRRLKSTTNSSTDDYMSDFGSGRGSRRAMSRASIKRAPTRQGSGVLDPDNHSHAGSATLMTHANRNVLNRQYASSSHATGSPKPGRIATPPESPLLNAATHGCLRLVNSNRKCHTVTPGGMLAVEEIAEVDYGLTEDLMAENAGRGIAEVALMAINPGGRRLARENPNARPVIVVLAGNHRAGARAVAAARQLQARGPKVMVALLGFERNADWDKDVRRQVDLFKKFGGSVRAWPDLEEALKRLQAPPELIIDALLGRHKEFDALGDGDRRSVLSIVGWANKSRAACLAVETPSGVGGSTGEVAILEGEPLEVRAKYIVCLGAPRSGLLKALQNGAGRDPSWLIWVVDIGVNRPWKSAGIGGGKGVRFEGEWVVQARFEEEVQA